MFLPVGDAPNPPGFRAWLTWALLAANVLVYLLLTLPLSTTPVDPSDPRVDAYVELLRPQVPPDVPVDQLVAAISQWDLFLFEYGYKSGAPSVVDLFASMFLHAGLLHLAGNMLFLWIYGNNVEHRLGRFGYLLAYLGTGIAATLTFAWLSGPSMIPMAGASGAISGLLGLYFLMFPRNKVKIFVFLFPLLATTWMVPARIVLGLYVLVDNLLPMVFGAGGGVAYGAHLGGFVAGLLLAVVGERLDWRAPWTDRVAARGRGSLDELRDALSSHDRKRALDAYGRLSPGQASHLELDQRLRLAHYLEQAGHRIAAVRLLRGGLERSQGSARARLHLALGEIMARLDELPSAFQHLIAAMQGDPVTAARARRLLDSLGVDPRLVQQPR